MKKGGAVNLVLHSVELSAPADAIPDSITIDLTGLDFHDSVHISTIKLPEGCRPADTKTDLTVVTIVPPTVYTGRGAGRGAATSAAPRRRGRRSGQGRRRGSGQRRRRRSGQGARRQEVKTGFAPLLAIEVRPRASGRAFSLEGPSCCSSQASAIPARATPGTATTSASWRSRRSPREHRIGPFRSRFQGVIAEGAIGQTRVALLTPQTFMNESGRSVGEAMRFYKLDLDAVVVVHDELDLAPAKVRVKVGGGNAGHNGLRSISAHIGNDYKRVRLGIGHPGDKRAGLSLRARRFRQGGNGLGRRGLRRASARFADLLAQGQDASFQNKVHLAVEAAGFGEKDEE